MIDFMTNNPLVTLLLAYIAGETIVRPIKYIVRHLNIRKQGWPPAHCDADGDGVESADDN